MNASRKFCDGKCSPKARGDGECLQCGRLLSPAGYSKHEGTVLARHRSRSGRLEIVLSAEHTTRHTRWMVSVKGDTGPTDIKEFTSVPLQVAKDYANARWAD